MVAEITDITLPGTGLRMPAEIPGSRSEIPERLSRHETRAGSLKVRAARQVRMSATAMEIPEAKARHSGIRHSVTRLHTAQIPDRVPETSGRVPAQISVVRQISRRQARRLRRDQGRPQTQNPPRSQTAERSESLSVRRPESSNSGRESSDSLRLRNSTIWSFRESRTDMIMSS